MPNAKISDWIAAGTFLVWVVDPVRRRARIYRADGSETLVSEHESLSGEVVLPGLKVLLAEMLL